MEDKHLYRETQWDVSAEESRAHHGLVAIGFAVLAVLVIAFCIWTFGGHGGAAWEFEADDALPIMTVKVTGGNTVAAPGDYWYSRDGFVQLQLSGGSIPGEEIERVTYDAALKTLTVKLKNQGDVPTTMDIALTEWRLEPRRVLRCRGGACQDYLSGRLDKRSCQSRRLGGIDAVPGQHIQK